MDFIPFLVDLYITAMCNMDCHHCNASTIGRVSSMRLRKVLSLIDELYEMGTTNLAITGGAPFLHKECLAIIEYACAKKGWLVSVNTNGTTLRESTIERLSEKGESVQIVFSLDGYSPETYGILRRSRYGSSGEHLFPVVLEKIKYCLKHSMNATVNYVLTRPTLRYFFPTVERVCGELGVQVLGIKFFPHGQGFHRYHQLEIPYEEWHEFLVNATRMAERDCSFDNLVQLSVTCPWELYLPLLREGYHKETVERIWNYKSPLAWTRYSDFRNVGCDAGVTHCAINAEGFLTPCGTIPYLDSLYAGNVNHTSFSDLWANADLLSRLRAIKLEDIGEPCISCWLKNVCGGGCRARAFVLSGQLEAPDPSCPIVRTRS